MKEMKCLLCLVLCLLSCGSFVQCNSEDDERVTEEYREKFRHAFQQVENVTSITVDSVETVGIRDFDCDLDSDEPDSIHNLSPEYVDVVAAMGDSVTAGFGAGAKTIIGDIIQYRGLSWSIGGDKDLTEVATLANIFRVFNPELKGFSIKTGSPRSPDAGLNVAVSGAKAGGMLSQAKDLVDKMEILGVTSEQWKVITLWIGGNDLCAIDSDGVPKDLAEGYVDSIEEALDYLHVHVTRAFVNVVEMIDVADLHIVRGILCDIVHGIACKSITSEELRVKVTETVILYNERLKELIDRKYRDTADDFAVVLQPFFSETKVPRLENDKPDKSYFAPDCFHFSQKGHGVGARYLWINMFEPLGEKTNEVDWENIDPLKCPDDYPYFRTYKNSPGLVNANSNDQESPHSTNLLAILVGTGVGVFLVAMTVMVVAMGVIKVKRRNNRVRGPTEKMQLL